MNMNTPNVIEVKAIDETHIYIKFENGKEKVYDMKPIIEKIKYYVRLKDREYFKQVKPCYNTVEWPNGEDVCPENLYYDSVDYKK